MKLTIVAGDQSVGVDGEFFATIDLSQLDPAIHAVQWDGEYGEIEFKTVFTNGALTKPHNQLITDITPFQFAVDAWNAKKAEIEAMQISEVIPVTDMSNGDNAENGVSTDV
jgi:hypothetical protein